MTAPAIPTAYWPMTSLLRSLARAGWGDLDGAKARGQRNVLRALADQLPDGSAEGLTTAHQLADASGYSVRWVEQCLRELEARGLIVWHRGGVHYRKPRPSLIRVVKARLVDLILSARPELAARVAARAERTTARLAKLARAFVRVKPGKYRRVSPELAAAPSHLKGGTGARRAPLNLLPLVGDTQTTPCDHGEPRGQRYCALCRHGIPA